MQRPKVDPSTAAKVHALIERCRAQGRDVVQALDGAGYLNFPTLEDYQHHAALQAVAWGLDTISVDQIRRELVDASQPLTPHETKQLVVAWLRMLSAQQLPSATQPTKEKQ